MTINEAKKLVAKEYPGLLINSCVLYDGKYYFELVSEEGQILLIGGLLTVDQKTGDFGVFNPLHSDINIDEFKEVQKRKQIKFLNNT